MTISEETLRNIALTHAINAGAPDIVASAEKFLTFLKGSESKAKTANSSLSSQLTDEEIYARIHALKS